MNTRKTLGTIIIGVAITLAIASIPLIIAGTDQITDKLIVHTSAYTGNVNITNQADYYTRMLRGEVVSRKLFQGQLTGVSLFLSILFMGISVVTMVAFKEAKYSIKAIIYPTLIFSTIGIFIANIFSAVDSDTRFELDLAFNWTLFFVIFGLGVFISLISLGNDLIKK
jgi:hypothetical protein